MNEDRAAVRRAALDLGYLALNDSDTYIESVVELIMLVCEPLRHHGLYDFQRANLATRARALGFDIGMRHGYLRPPPPQTLFLHRKLVGSFLLCASLRARVDVRELILPYLRANGDKPLRRAQ
jgi:nitroreductase